MRSAMPPLSPRGREPSGGRRRPWVRFFLLIGTLLSLSSLASVGIGQGTDSAPVPVIHFTDLYHPHNDPDDHWDLATLFALAQKGSIDLKTVVIDYPLSSQPGDPALVAVAQLNALTGLSVPTLIGSATSVLSGGDPPPSGRAFLQKVEEVLETSPAPAVLQVTGSCRDLALLGRVYPDLLARKVRAVYLNAGTGTTDPAQGANLEYNSQLGLADYSAAFDLPCPVYWLPCFETLTGSQFQVQEYGSYWAFKQSDILPDLAPGLQNFFLYALERSAEPAWLRSLEKPPDPGLLAKQGSVNRNMWCTAGFLHSAGLTVDGAGRLVPVEASVTNPLYEFQPIDLQSDPSGVKTWRSDPGSRNRSIFRVLDRKHYSHAMALALRDLLTDLR